MGLYSINRLTNIGFSNLIESVDTNIEESVVEESPLSLFEAVQYLQEEEQKMFDTVISSDFESLFKEFGLNKTINEADENKEEEKKDEDKKEATKSDNGDKNLAQRIWAKIKEIAGKIKNAIVGAFNAISRKLEELFKADEKIIAKYKPAIEKCNDFSKFEFDETELALNLDSDVISKIVAGLVKVRDSVSFEDGSVTTNTEDITKTLNGTVEELEKITKDGFKKYTKLSKDQILKLISILDPKKSRATLLDKLSSGAITITKKIEAASNGSGDDEKEAHDKYEKVKVTSQALVKMARLSIDAIKKNVTAARRILILAGRFALNETKDTADVETEKKEEKKESGKEESALIAMASDMYVTEMFAMI